ncbi:collagen alpha-3(vi) chain [Plakobranchus ocellatus]|uniref:Collagen alpha-3(Vi) chain n=1 Tax=Plakobranchus ocellatus TaxID=259542 RepID=A0AAV3YXR1_9GAST|nr:collagen alpha-3(vi) chain [Plakobranchus ocellatus]
MRTEMFTARNGDRPDVENICIIVTDGVSNINSRRTIPEAEQARAEGIHIYAIGIGLTDTRELDGIASKPVDENRFAVQEFTELRDLRHRVFSALCSTEAPVITTPRPGPVSCADARIDLVFVLDASTSVTEPNFELMKDFVKDFLYEADIDGGNVRVGVIIYSTEDHVEFQMNTYRSKVDVYNAVDNIPYRYGSTNTADALKTMRTEMFTARNGDRPDVENICIIVTDGVSNINSRRTIPEAEQARAEGIHIYAIGIGLTDTKELDGIASKPVEENRFAVQEFSELRDLRHQVFSALCE